MTLSTITLTHKKEFYKETVNSSLFTETSKQQSIYHRYSVVVENPLFATNNQIGRKCNDPYKFIIIIRNSLRIPKVINSCYNCGTRHVNLDKALAISHEWGKGRIVIATYETYNYPRSFVTFRSKLGPGWLMSEVVGLPNNSYKLITNTAWLHARLCKLQKRIHSTRSRKW